MGAVQLVDYSRPGFAVVYAEPLASASAAADERAASATRLAIRDGNVATRLEPAHAALATGGRVVVRNDSRSLHVVSCPSAGVVKNLAPGETMEVPVPGAGEYAFFLLDVPGANSTVFAAPGAHAVVSDSGHFELVDLEPGRQQIHAWHPRLPPLSVEVSLQPGAVLRIDLEMGVGRDTPEEADAR